MTHEADSTSEEAKIPFHSNFFNDNTTSTCDFDINEPQSWPPNLLSNLSALSKSNLTSSSIPRRRRSLPELERVDEDGTRTLDWDSEHQRPQLRETTLVCEL